MSNNSVAVSLLRSSLIFVLLFVGDCKPSEVKAFTTDYLEKVVEPCDWLALWCTDGFDVLVEVRPRFYIVD